jgi:hypothetical protein
MSCYRSEDRDSIPVKRCDFLFVTISSGSGPHKAFYALVRSQGIKYPFSERGNSPLSAAQIGNACPLLSLFLYAWCSRSGITLL